MHINPCSRVADVPDELAQAFASMPHYATALGRDDNGNGYDPLSTEGPHRTILRLTGYALAGRRGDRAVYLLRFGSGTFAAYDLGHTLHLSDYQPAHERTLEAAAIRAAQVLANLPTPADPAALIRSALAEVGERANVSDFHAASAWSRVMDRLEQALELMPEPAADLAAAV